MEETKGEDGAKSPQYYSDSGDSVFVGRGRRIALIPPEHNTTALPGSLGLKNTKRLVLREPPVPKFSVSNAVDRRCRFCMYYILRCVMGTETATNLAQCDKPGDDNISNVEVIVG